MEKLSFFGALALIVLVSSPFVFAVDLCENVSRKYEDLCREIIKADISKSDKIDLIENIGHVETYNPIPNERYQENFCSENDCLIPSDLDYSVDEEKFGYFLEIIILFLCIYCLFVLAKKYWGKAWHLAGS